jgi:hypothetical protein
MNSDFDKLIGLLKNRDSVISPLWSKAITEINKEKDPSNIRSLHKYILVPLEANNKLVSNQLDIIEKFITFSDCHKVLEMGGGFGNFCRLFSNRKKNVDYTILDLPEMIKFSSKFLISNCIPCKFVKIENAEEILNKGFDLFVSNYCLSETPEEFRKLFLKVLLDGGTGKIENVAILDTKHEMEGELVPLLSSIYNKVNVTFVKKHGDIYAFTGTNRK